VGSLTRASRDRLAAASGIQRIPWLHQGLRIGTTFALVCVGWIFFRAGSVSDAWYILTHLFSGWTDLAQSLQDPSFVRSQILLGQRAWDFAVVILAILGMEMVHLKQRHTAMRHFVTNQPCWIRWPVYYALTLAIIYFGVFTHAGFIYFQF